MLRPEVDVLTFSIGKLPMQEPIMSDQVDNTREERARIVAEVNASFAIEDLEPDADDLRIQQEFIEGTATLDDMLEHARRFAAQKGEQQP